MSGKQANRVLQDTAANNQVVEFLRDPAAYADKPKRVDVLETHISWVFLADQFAFKLKKPVRFDFLDFSTPERRRTACEVEVRLNRRLARHVYLDVLPITRHKGRLELDGEGASVDWIVKMSRLPAERSLDRLILSGQINEPQVQQVAQTLCRFFTHLPPITIRPDDYRRRIEKNIQQNRDGLLAKHGDFNATTIQRIHEAQLL
jgi:aminoglycoside phosphotransferase family enzyme